MDEKKITNICIAALAGVYGVVFGKCFKKLWDRNNEERKRKNTPCLFLDGISQEQFERMVKKAGRNIRRITSLSVTDAVVYGRFRSQSGLSEWDFDIDFNDYGHLTGKYWLKSGNPDSSVPDCLADNISTMIQDFPCGFEYSESNEWENSTESEEDNFNYDYEREQENLERMRRQAEAFNEKERARHRKLTRNYVCSTIVFLAIIMSLIAIHQGWIFSEKIEVGLSAKQMVGMDCDEVVNSLETDGFTNVQTVPEYDLEIAEINQENTVSKININGNGEFKAKEKYPYNAKIEVTYHVLKNVCVPISAKEAEGSNYKEIEALLREAGFDKITTTPDYDLVTGWINKEYAIESITINGDEDFSESESFRADAEIEIVFHRFKRDNDE